MQIVLRRIPLVVRRHVLNPITLLLAREINFLGSNAELKDPGLVETMGPMSPPVGRVKI